MLKRIITNQINGSKTFIAVKQVIRYIFILVLISNQVKSQDLNKGTFSKLIESNHLTNVKSGIVMTGIRSDTLFVIKYKEIFNDIDILPVVTLKKEASLILFNDELNEKEENSGIKSQIIDVECNEEVTFVILQTIIFFKKNEDNSFGNRTLFYSKNKGVFRVDYQKDKFLINKDLWIYSEGDFYY